MITLSTRIPRLPAFAFVSLCALFFLSPTQSAEGAGKKTMIRFVCPAPLGGQTECILASKDKKGAWRESKKLELRPSFISEWMEVSPGEVGVCIRKDNQLVVQGSFTVPEKTGRALAILLPGADKDQYSTQLVDAGKLAFVKGKTLLINSSTVACTVKLGTKETECKPDEVQVVQPAVDDQGMYQMMVSHTGKSGDVVTCHDRYISINNTARDFLFLIPDPGMLVKVVTMSDFGPFE